jgi:hypothetical protein
LHATYVHSPIFTLVADLIGPIGPQKRAFLFVVDAFTRYGILTLLPDMKSDSVATAFERDVLWVFGIPRHLHTDHGTHFQGAFSTLMDKYHIHHTLASASHHESAGMAERNSATVLRKMLVTTYEVAAMDDLARVGSQAIYFYNTTANRAIGMSPYRALFGRDARSPLDAGMDVTPVALTVSQMEDVVANTHKLVGRKPPLRGCSRQAFAS